MLISRQRLHQAKHYGATLKGFLVQAARAAQAIAKGMVLGIEKGKLEGKLEEAVNTLNRLLNKRFGSTPPEIIVKIETATLAQVESWFDRAIDARQLEDVFRGGSLH
jgi:hypothetical protein